MRAMIVPLFALVIVGAGEPQQSTLDNPAYTTPPEAWRTVEEALKREPLALPPPPDEAELAACRDAITEAREGSGQPPLLQREPASPEKPHAIYAVDRTQDGCSVMVMMGDSEDIRPLPLPAEEAEGVMPAEAEAGEQ